MIAHDCAHHAVAEGKIEFGKLAQEMLRSFTLVQGIAGVDAGFASETACLYSSPPWRERGPGHGLKSRFFGCVV